VTVEAATLVTAATPTPTPTQPTPTPTLTFTPPPPDDGLPPDHYWLERPIPEGWTNYLDRTYPYGGTQGGRYPPHSGVEFWNPVDTPIVAVADGTIIHAGTDLDIVFGPERVYYGHLIVQQLDQTYNGQPVYALYGHIKDWYVEAEQRVKQGDVIAGVGSAGVAIGPHLHFEVRIGDPEDFGSTRNPDLWIKPFYGYGTLAGRVVNPDGAFLPEVSITVRGPDAVRYTWTYASNLMNSDDEWGENFTLGDLPEGWYTVTTRSERHSYEAQVYIRAGRTGWVEFVFD
jgi:murein DD-endopeptidase MepM/ murein hydrolase activator NlpD